jgi:hypothetical protein
VRSGRRDDRINPVRRLRCGIDTPVGWARPTAAHVIAKDFEILGLALIVRRTRPEVDMRRALRELTGVALLILVSWTAPARAGEVIVIVRPDGVEPQVLHATTGERVDFINRTGKPVHLQFKGDIRQHQVVQIPAIGPIWVVFHRPGTHPYEVHAYVTEREMRTLTGLVEAVEDPRHADPSPTCGITAMGVCIEQ